MPVVDSAGVPIYYEVAGKGRPIVLVHGYLSSLEGNWGRAGGSSFSSGRDAAWSGWTVGGTAGVASPMIPLHTTTLGCPATCSPSWTLPDSSVST